MGKVFRYETLIRERHLDTFGHVNNVTYLELLEEARWEILDQGNYPLSKIQDEQIGPIVLEVNIRFKHELAVRTPIRIETEWLEYKRKIFKLRHQILSPDRTIVYAEALITAGLFDMKARKLIRPTQDWLSAIAVSEGEVLS